jgi:hypothetical protein
MCSPLPCLTSAIEPTTQLILHWERRSKAVRLTDSGEHLRAVPKKDCVTLETGVAAKKRCIHITRLDIWMCRNLLLAGGAVVREREGRRHRLCRA